MKRQPRVQGLTMMVIMTVCARATWAQTPAVPQSESSASAEPEVVTPVQRRDPEVPSPHAAKPSAPPPSAVAPPGAGEPPATRAYGKAILVASYAPALALAMLTFVASVGSDDDPQHPRPTDPHLMLFLPVVGSFMAAAKSPEDRGILIGDGVVQTAGLVLLLHGALSANGSSGEHVALSVAPTRLGADGNGVAVWGRF